jgi:LemA protein
MQKKKLGWLIAGGVILVLAIWLITTYNSLVKKEENVKLQWAEVQNTYQRRLDLIPNLVNTVKGVSEFEQGTLIKIAEARNNAMSVRTDEITAESYQRQKNVQDTLAAATNRLIAVVEKYPTLKGTAAYAGLQTQLEGTERRIKVARNDFNAAVADYNLSVRSASGTNLVAKLFGFKVREGFQAVAGADKSVDIKF